MKKMAKKNFKGGLDSLIEDSLGIKPKDNKTEQQENKNPETESSIDSGQVDAVSSKEVAALKIEIANIKHELYLWRTGKITTDNFSSTLIKHGLKFNAETNEIEDL